jgi:YbgC/YbaW family acyl-CoA thioester hydrolase
MSNVPQTIRREDFRFLDRLRVRWAEVDMQKIVFNGHYLMYFDSAVAGYWRALAMPYHETMEKFQGDLYVRKATLEYLGSARYDDMLEVGIRCGRIGNSSMVFTAAVLRGGQCLVHGDLVYVFADPQTQTSRPVPAALRQVLQGFEAGEAMLQVQLGAWPELGAHARALREAVFVQEQGIDAGLIVDDADPAALHAVAHNRFGLPVGTGRLVDLGQGVSKIGRMATLASVRGAGAGQAVLAALTEAARGRGHRELVLHAQASAVGFYLRLGFVPVGERFSEAGVEHQAMQKAL